MRKLTGSSKLIHVYIAGRFGPEKHLGFVEAENNQCFRQDTYTAFDYVLNTTLAAEFFTNPLGLGNLHKYRKWKGARK